jgi:uncharacterized protein (DUF2062 family)
MLYYKNCSSNKKENFMFSKFGWLKFKKVLHKAFEEGSCPKKMALSFCAGIYIAFSPFPGGHTIMMLISKWLFRLNFPVLFFATSINNPWTAIPFFSLDYVFGYWLTHSVIGWDPGWNISLAKFFGSGEICLWSFLLGGNILGIAGAILCYPAIRKLFERFGSRSNFESEEVFGARVDTDDCFDRVRSKDKLGTKDESFDNK